MKPKDAKRSAIKTMQRLDRFCRRNKQFCELFRETNSATTLALALAKISLIFPFSAAGMEFPRIVKQGVLS
jgi:hypothetical protein